MKTIAQTKAAKAAVALALALCALAPANAAQPASGAMTYPVPGDQGALSISVGPDGTLWLRQTSAIGRISANGTITEFRLPQLSLVDGSLAFAPDGSLWFSDSSSCTLRKLAADGTIAEERTAVVGGSGFTPQTGAFWIRCLRKAARVDSGGTATLLPDFKPTKIAVGSDTLWGVEWPNIERIDAGGRRATFPVPSGDHFGPTSLALGPDGNLWFTDTGGNRIGRITPAGKVDEFRVAAFDSKPAAIVAGPDGAMWFAQQNAIGRITTTGAITEYAMPSGVVPVGLAAGPDRAIWFAASDRIGRLPVDAIPASLAALEPQNPYLAYTSYEFDAKAGAGTTLDLRLFFHLLTNVTVDPTALNFRMRRIDGSTRPWSTLHPSDSAPGQQAIFTIPNERGATYQIAFDAARAIVPVGDGPPGESVSDIDSTRDVSPPAASMPDYNTFLLTIPSATVAKPDAVLARASKRYVNAMVRISRAGLTMFGSFDSPHAPPFRRKLRVGEHVKVVSIDREGSAESSGGPLGVVEHTVPVSLARFVASSIRVVVKNTDVNKTDPDFCYLTFASPEEMQLYLQP